MRLSPSSRQPSAPQVQHIHGCRRRFCILKLVAYTFTWRREEFLPGLLSGSLNRSVVQTGFLLRIHATCYMSTRLSSSAKHNSYGTHPLPWGCAGSVEPHNQRPHCPAPFDHVQPCRSLCTGTSHVAEHKNVLSKLSPGKGLQGAWRAQTRVRDPSTRRNDPRIAFQGPKKGSFVRNSRSKGKPGQESWPPRASLLLPLFLPIQSLHLDPHDH